MKQEVFTHRRKIEPQMVDSSGVLALRSVLLLNQQAGEAHIEHMGHSAADLIKNYNLTFIFARITAQIFALPHLGDEVTVTTWCSPTEGLYYPRHYVIKNTEGQVLTETFAYAAALDIEKRKLLRPDSAGPVEDFLYFDDPGSCPKPPRLRTEKDLPFIMDFAVEQRYLDYNGHMNNTHYATVVARAAQKFGINPKQVTLQFHSEALQGDVLRVEGKTSEKGLQLRGTHPRGVSFEALVE